MMISETFHCGVFISDYTRYGQTQDARQGSFTGVRIRTEDDGIIPSFGLTNENNVPLVVVNNEENMGFYTRSNGEKVSQCECIVYSDRHDKRKGWMAFLELKYCEAKNVYQNMREGISQLRATCNYVMKEKREFEASRYKKYLVISTPGVVPLDPFDASYFDQDFILTVREETGAVLRASNCGHVKTPAVVEFE